MKNIFVHVLLQVWDLYIVYIVYIVYSIYFKVTEQ